MRIARLLFYSACLLLPILSLRLTGDNVTASDVLFALSFVAYLVHRPRDVSHHLARSQLAAYLVLMGGALAAFRADVFVPHWLNVARIIFIVLVWPWLAVGLLTERRHVKVCIFLWLVGSTAFSVAGIYQSIYRGSSFESGRIPGLAQHVTDAGGILSISIPAFLGILLTSTSASARMAGLCGLGLASTALVLTGSVSGFAVASAGLLAVAFTMRRSMHPLSAICGLALISGAVVVATRLQTSSGLGISALSRINSTTSGRYDTLGARLATDEYAWQAILAQPFVGRGLDPWSGLTVAGLQTHNMLLLAWFQGGVLFLAGLLVFAWTPLRLSTRAVKAEPMQQILAVAFLAAVAFSMTSPLLAQRYIWLPAVLLVSLEAIRKRRRESEAAWAHMVTDTRMLSVSSHRDSPLAGFEPR